MTEAVQIAMIVATGPMLIGLAGVAVSWINGRKITEVHKSTNSRLDELLKAAKIAAHAEGMADQRAQSKKTKKKRKHAVTKRE